MDWFQGLVVMRGPEIACYLEFSFGIIFEKLIFAYQPLKDNVFSPFNNSRPLLHNHPIAPSIACFCDRN